MYKLKKGESYPLAKTLSQCYIGLGWDITPSQSGHPYDLDVVALIMGSNGKLLPAPHGVVFYNNPTFPALEESQWKSYGSKRNETLIQQQPIWITGDDRDGDGGGDDESIQIDFTKLPPTVNEIVVAVTIYDAQIRKQDFSQVNSYIRIAQSASYPDMARYDMDDQLLTETSLILGKLKLVNNSWTFEATGRASHDDLENLIMKFA